MTPIQTFAAVVIAVIIIAYIVIDDRHAPKENEPQEKQPDFETAYEQIKIEIDNACTFGQCRLLEYAIAEFHKEFYKYDHPRVSKLAAKLYAMLQNKYVRVKSDQIKA